MMEEIPSSGIGINLRNAPQYGYDERLIIPEIRPDGYQVQGPRVSTPTPKLVRIGSRKPLDYLENIL
jgi:hypothetical protein